MGHLTFGIMEQMLEDDNLHLVSRLNVNIQE
jgi:hypothetical protein